MTFHDSSRSCDRQIMIAGQCGCLGMGLRKGGDGIKCTPRVWTTIHEVPNKDDPTILIVVTTLQHVEDRRELLGVTVNVADRRDRSIDSRFKIQFLAPYVAMNQQLKSTTY